MAEINNMILQFKIQIQGISKPPVWRVVLVPDYFTFMQFHEVIQTVFGWQSTHLYQFCPKGYGSSPTIGEIDPDFDSIEIDAEEITLKKIFKKEGQTFTYIYDFGDDWIHKITLEDILTTDQKYAACIKGKGACPPDDCDGIYGYAQMKQILNDPTHEEYQEYKDWLGLDDDIEWDPDFFSKEELDDINQDLKDI